MYKILIIADLSRGREIRFLALRVRYRQTSVDGLREQSANGYCGSKRKAVIEEGK
jgi:hypothetical protein